MIDADLIAQFADWRTSVSRWNREFMLRCAENFRFAIGLQWNTDDIELLKEAGKPYLTYNEILPQLNILYSQYLENIFEPVALPKRRGSATTGIILTTILKHILDLCNGSFEEAQMFLDGITCGIGNIGATIDMADSPISGDVIIKRISPFNVEWDWSSSDYNPDVSNRFVTEKWYWTKEQIILAYPKKKSDIETGGLTWVEGETDMSDEQRTTGGDYEEVSQSEDGSLSKNEARGNANQHCVRQTWWLKQERKPHLIDRETEKKIVVADVQAAKLFSAMNGNRFIIRDEIAKILRCTTYVGQVVLQDVENPFGPNVTKYPIRRYFPYYFDGYWFGHVDNLKDPQSEINKRKSQILHAINSIVKFYFLNQDSLGAKPEDIQAVLNGDTNELKYKTTKPELVVPNLMAGVSALAGIADNNEATMERIGGVSAPAMGRQEYSGQPGYAIEQLINRTNKGQSNIIQNMSRTRQELYEVLVDLICNTDTYTEWEMLEMVDEDDIVTQQITQKLQSRLRPPPQQPQPPDPAALQALQQLNPQQAAIDIPQATMAFQTAARQYVQEKESYDKYLKLEVMKYILEELKSMSFGKYGIKVSQKPHSETMQIANFGMLLELLKIGKQVPDDILYEASTLPESMKEKLIDRYKQAMQAAQMAQAQPQMAGVGK